MLRFSTAEKKESAIETPELQETQTIKLLALGDSLSSGYISPYEAYASPYTNFLADSLTEASTQENVFKFTNVAVPGYTTEQVKYLQLRKLQETTDFDFDIVMLLAGTNDLADSSKSAKDKAGEIILNLYSMYKKILNSPNSPQLVVMTIPQIDYYVPKYIKTRNRVNAFIREFASKYNNVLLADLEKHLPYARNEQRWPQNPESNWADNIHMSPIGYAKMAEIIHETLQTTLSESHSPRILL